jgi:uracil-DNA glycosylase family 4
MEFSGSSQPELLIIGEAPGEREDQKGIPFVGDAGSLLRNALIEFGFTDENTAFTNVVRCRPVGNKITKKAINYCSRFVLEDIEKLNAPIVFLHGNVPLNAVLGQTGISQWNGVPVEKERLYVPLFHPAYILRNSNATDEWLAGMLGALEGTEKKKKFNRTFPKILEDIQAMKDQLAECEYISYDVETSSLDAFSENSSIISVSLAGGDYSYAFPIDHPESWWNRESSYKHMSERDAVVQTLTDILLDHDGHVIGHNIKFDQMQTFGNLDFMFASGGDTMLVSHLLDSRQGIHGLKRLAGINLGMYEYEQELTTYIREHREANPNYGGSYAKIPLEILLPYGAMDSEATLMLHDKLFPELTDRQAILYDQLILPVSDVLCEMQCNGIKLDKYIAERYLAIYSQKQRETYVEILDDHYVRIMSKDRNKALKEVNKKKRKKVIYEFNPQSFAQLLDLYENYYNIALPKVTRPDGTVRSTTSGGALRPQEDMYPILRMIRYYKLLGKMMSTYLRPAATGVWESGDGRVRTSYNLHGTRTGRLSSSGDKDKHSKGMNLQNIPTPEKEPGTLLEILPIKNIFTHSYHRKPSLCVSSIGEKFIMYNAKELYGDGVVMSVDFSGMELRCFASLADCEPMLEIHRSGKDFHSSVALRALTGKPIQDITFEEISKLEKSIRYRYKWTNWTLLYGGDANTLHHLYNMPMDEAEQLVADYFEAFPEVRDFQDSTIEFAEDHGYVESPFGRREYLYYINDSDMKKRNADRRAAVNMPVQSAASDTLLLALINVADRLRGMKTRLVNTVHDSIMLDVPKSEVMQAAKICVDCMENVKDYAKDYAPEIDMSWLKSPLKADVDVGSHYGTMISLEKWEELYG